LGVVGFLGFYAYSIKVIFCYSSEVIGPLAFINSYKNSGIKMAGYYDQLNIMPNHPTKYES
jgi:hypothetical protein